MNQHHSARDVMRSPWLPLVGSVALTAAAFLPWLRLGDVGLSGVPDPTGYFVLVLGAIGVLLSAIRMLTRRDTGQGLMLVGLAALTALVVVWQTGPRTIADRAQAHADAVALVDAVPMQAVPPVGVGYGLVLGLAGAAVVSVSGLAGTLGRSDT